MDILKLVTPAPEHEEQVMSYRKEMLDNHDSFDGSSGLGKVESYSDWLRFEERGRAAHKDSYVPSDQYLAVRQSDNKVVGMIDYRHSPLSEFLLNVGGHIGYCVRPSERRKGYAKEMLRLLLPLCKENGETRVLIACDKDNEASRRTITANGGVLENEIKADVKFSPCGVIQRYWINL